MKTLVQQTSHQAMIAIKAIGLTCTCVKSYFIKSKQRHGSLVYGHP
jgi:hypothetical protein